MSTNLKTFKAYKKLRDSLEMMDGGPGSGNFGHGGRPGEVGGSSSSGGSSKSSENTGAQKNTNTTSSNFLTKRGQENVKLYASAYSDDLEEAAISASNFYKEGLKNKRSGLASAINGLINNFPDEIENDEYMKHALSQMAYGLGRNDATYRYYEDSPEANVIVDTLLESQWGGKYTSSHPSKLNVTHEVLTHRGPVTPSNTGKYKPNFS